LSKQTSKNLDPENVKKIEEDNDKSQNQDIEPPKEDKSPKITIGDRSTIMENSNKLEQLMKQIEKTEGKSNTTQPDENSNPTGAPNTTESYPTEPNTPQTNDDNTPTEPYTETKITEIDDKIKELSKLLGEYN